MVAAGAASPATIVAACVSMEWNGIIPNITILLPNFGVCVVGWDASRLGGQGVLTP